jgi:ActR/RegA family two-component response regulator
MRALETGPVVVARVKWEKGQESEEDHGDMKEATARALEWAKKMFGKDAERRVEGGKES